MMGPDSTFFVSATDRGAGAMQVVSFEFGRFHGVGHYPSAGASGPGPANGGLYVVYSGTQYENMRTFQTPGLSAWEVDVTGVDASTRVVVGRFAFTAVQTAVNGVIGVVDSAVVHVTYGAFRVRYP
jgi:hypothetical protein